MIDLEHKEAPMKDETKTSIHGCCNHSHEPRQSHPVKAAQEIAHEHAHAGVNPRTIPVTFDGPAAAMCASTAASCCSEPAAHPTHEKEHAESTAILSLDYLGIVASTLCLIHCLAMPFIIAFLPFLGWQFLEGETAHHVLAAFVFAFALFAIVPGYLKHRKQAVLVFMLIGLGCVAFATFVAGPVFGEQTELPIITFGNLILVATHWRNRGLCKCSHEHGHTQAT